MAITVEGMQRGVGVYISIVLMVFACGIAGCKPKEHTTTSSVTLGDLPRAALEMQTAFVKEIGAHGGAPDGQIPSNYWNDPIKALNPIRIYFHRMNILVVQQINDRVETGKYICSPISSYWPQSGVDGLDLTFVSASVYNYRRICPDGSANER